MVKILPELTRIEDTETDRVALYQRVMQNEISDLQLYLSALLSYDFCILEGIFEDKDQKTLVIIFEVSDFVEDARNHPTLLSIISTIYFMTPPPNFLYFCIDIAILNEFYLAKTQGNLESEDEVKLLQFSAILLKYWSEVTGQPTPLS